MLAEVPASYAQVTVDTSKITCEQFLLLRDSYAFTFWLSGYYHGRRNEPVVETETFKSRAKKLRAACLATKNSKTPVMQLIETATTR
jgi:acid stress chaperone HdeB